MKQFCVKGNKDGGEPGVLRKKEGTPCPSELTPLLKERRGLGKMTGVEKPFPVDEKLVQRGHKEKSDEALHPGSKSRKRMIRKSMGGWLRRSGGAGWVQSPDKRG